MTNLRHVEIEFKAADWGETEIRVFPRAFLAEMTTHAVRIRDNESEFFLADLSRVVRFDSRLVSSMVSEADRDVMDTRVRSFCADRQRISAIKHVREVLGLGLKGAKEYVDNLSPVRVDYDDIPF